MGGGAHSIHMGRRLVLFRLGQNGVRFPPPTPPTFSETRPICATFLEYLRNQSSINTRRFLLIPNVIRYVKQWVSPLSVTTPLRNSPTQYLTRRSANERGNRTDASGVDVGDMDWGKGVQFQYNAMIHREIQMRFLHRITRRGSGEVAAPSPSIPAEWSEDKEGPTPLPPTPIRVGGERKCL